MAPTSDIRCEVAEELRDLVSEHSAVQCDAVSHVLGLKYEVHGCIAAFNREDVTALADLIDPTCHAVHDNPPADDEFICSECGALVGIEDMFMSNYCEQCGARVVNGNDD